MFEETGNRIGDLLRRSFDLAIEFATLGEYGLGGPRSDPHWASWAAPDSEPERLAPVAAVRLAPRVERNVRPSTVAARLRVERLEREQEVATKDRPAIADDCGARTIAGRRPSRIPRTRRLRAGAPAAPAQPCTIAEGDHG